jgi:hypothetical protein
MNANVRDIGLALVLAVAGCVSVPPGPPPEIVQLEQELARLHNDPRIAPNADAELRNADAAVDLLASEGSRLNEEQFRHGVYLADRLVMIAEASGMARYEEQRGQSLGAERERLLARSATSTAAPPLTPLRPLPNEQRAHDRLVALQSRLNGLESHLGDRTLVVTLADYMFEQGRGEPRESTMRALDTLVAAVRAERGASLSVGPPPADGNGATLDARRAAAVRAYLATRGIDPAQLAYHPMASTTRMTGRVEIVVRAGY